MLAQRSHYPFPSAPVGGYLWFLLRCLDGVLLYFVAIVCAAAIQIGLEYWIRGPFSVGMAHALPYLGSAVAIGILLLILLVRLARWSISK